MNLDENRNLNKANLYTNERKYLFDQLEEEIDDPDKLKRKQNRARRKILDERLPRFPARLQYLIDDIRLIDNGGLLNTNYFSDGWTQFADINPRENLGQVPDSELGRIWKPTTEIEDEQRFGFAYGLMMRSVVEGFDRDRNTNQLAWGVILGLYGEPKSNYFREKRRMNRFIEYLEERVSSKNESATEIEVELIEKLFKQALTEQYDPTNLNFLATHTGQKTQEIVDSAVEERFEYKQGERETPLLDELEQVIPDFHSKYYPLVKLYKIIELNIDIIEETDHNKVSATDLFQYIWSETGDIERSTLQSHVKKGKNTVGKLLNDFEGDGTDENWKKVPPIIRDISTPKSSDRKVQTTTYGDILGKCLYLDRGFEKIRRELAEWFVRETKEDTHQTTLENFEIQTDIRDARWEIQDWIFTENDEEFPTLEHYRRQTGFSTQPE